MKALKLQLVCLDPDTHDSGKQSLSISTSNTMALKNKQNFSKRAFCHASPTVWNSLPQTVISDLTVTTGTFKNRLKSALYSRAFLQ